MEGTSCPMRVIAWAALAGEGEQTLCVGAQCAWWVPKLNGCAFVKLAASFDALSKTMKALKAKLPKL